MAGSRKQRKLEQHNESSSDSEENNDQNELGDGEMEMIQVDFDVKVPEPPDFHGIKNLLHQLFLKAHINTSELADLIIAQRKITGVIKQADEDEMEIDDTDDLDVSFGVFSVINVTEKKNMDSINQIHTYLLSHCKKACDDDKFQTLKRILEDKEKDVGLIISERMVNIPPKIAVPLYSGLKKWNQENRNRHRIGSSYLELEAALLVYDMSKAAAKGEAFNFEYFMLICKIVVFKEGSKQENVIYTNAEEEIIAEAATLSYDFSVSAELDSGLAGNWTDDDIEGKRKRRVLLLPASQWDVMYNKMVAELET